MSEFLSEAEVASLFEPGWLARCDWCGWPLDGKPRGCAEGDCSMRPMPSNADTPRKAIVRKLLSERRALREALVEAQHAMNYWAASDGKFPMAREKARALLAGRKEEA